MIQIDMTDTLAHIAGCIERAKGEHAAMLVSKDNEDYAQLYVGDDEIPECAHEKAVTVFFGSKRTFDEILDNLERAF